MNGVSSCMFSAINRQTVGQFARVNCVFTCTEVDALADWPPERWSVYLAAHQRRRRPLWAIIKMKRVSEQVTESVSSSRTAFSSSAVV